MEQTRPIDLLFGIRISLFTTTGEKLFGKPGTPFVVNSDYGWLISGDSDISLESIPNITVNFANTETDHVKKFWELKNIPSKEIYKIKKENIVRNFSIHPIHEIQVEDTLCVCYLKRNVKN